ncbi:hypothetical protein AMK05_CH02689 [Rhizobium sp. N324]|nr:hypothetical protein AMK05_CH02689 [Rhizobium sp. N324]
MTPSLERLSTPNHLIHNSTMANRRNGDGFAGGGRPLLPSEGHIMGYMDKDIAPQSL